MTPNETETLKLAGIVLLWALGFIALAIGPWLVWGLWIERRSRRPPPSGRESRSLRPPASEGESRKERARRVIAELEPLINRYGAFLEASAHLIYAIPASRLDTTPQEIKAMLLRYGHAIRDCNLLDEQTRQMLRNGYSELARILPEAEGNENDSAHLDKIAAECIRLLKEFDSQFPPAARRR